MSSYGTNSSIELESQLLDYNKHLDEKIDYLLHAVEKKLDHLCISQVTHVPDKQLASSSTSQTLPTSSQNSFLTFKAPYIRDAKNFCCPSNSDIVQIKELCGSNNINSVVKHKSWTSELKTSLNKSILDHYASISIVQLIQQKNMLHHQSKLTTDTENRDDMQQKVKLIDEQIEQIRYRSHVRMFIPEDRNDTQIDWLSMSAKLTSSQHDARDCKLMWSNYLHHSIEKGEWTRDEDESLYQAVKKHGPNNWDDVAKELNSNRLPWQCCARFQSELSFSMSDEKQVIDQEGVEKIIEIIFLCKIGNFVPWDQVMYFIQSYSLSQVKYQWQKYIFKKNFTSSQWTQQEDNKLLRTVKKLGTKDWVRIANYIPNRSSRSCRERYVMRLRYQKRSLGTWKPKESAKLISLAEDCDMQWSKVAEHFPDRNPHQVRSKFCCLQKGHPQAFTSSKIKRRILYKTAKGFLSHYHKNKSKPRTEKELQDTLNMIFKTYSHAKPSKSLTYRSAQDETIYQSVIDLIASKVYLSPSPWTNSSLLSKVLTDALNQKVFIQGSREDTEFNSLVITPPCSTTIRGFECLSLLQTHLKEFVTNGLSDEELESINMDNIVSSHNFEKLMNVVVSLFLWPAILTRLEPPDPKKFEQEVSTSIVNKDNLYVVRELQKQLSLSSNLTK